MALVCQNGSITGRTLASQNGLFTAIDSRARMAITAVACPNGLACYLKCALLEPFGHGSHTGSGKSSTGGVGHGSTIT